MKKFCLLLILIAFCFQLSAQDNYRPFVEEGKSWKYYIEATKSWWDGKEAHWDTKYEHATLTIEGDTIVDGKEYKKVIYSSDNTLFYETDFIYGIIREENKKVFMRFFFDWYYDPEFPLSEEVLMYDFDLNVGDKFVEESVNFSTTLTLQSIEENDGKRIYKFSTNKDWIPVMQWVEGAGGFHGLGIEQRIPELTCIDCTRYTFLSLSCTLGDEILCSFDEDGNVVLGVEEIKTNSGKDGSIYDLQGRRLNAEPERGLYIKNGKKIAR